MPPCEAVGCRGRPSPVIAVAEGQRLVDGAFDRWELDSEHCAAEQKRPLPGSAVGTAVAEMARAAAAAAPAGSLASHDASKSAADLSPNLARSANCCKVTAPVIQPSRGVWDDGASTCPRDARVTLLAVNFSPSSKLIRDAAGETLGAGGDVADSTAPSNSNEEAPFE